MTGVIRPSGVATATPTCTSPCCVIASSPQLALTFGWWRSASAMRADDEVVEAHLHAGDLDHLLAHRDQVRDVVVGGQIEVRDRSRRLGEALGDGAAHRRERDDLRLERRRGRERRRAGFAPRPSAGAAGALCAFFTSAATMRPRGPLPCTLSRLTPISRAMRRASGEERCARPTPSAASARRSAARARVRSRRGPFCSIAS